MKDRDTGEHKGYAFVAFKTKQVAQKAIMEIHNKEFKVCKKPGEEGARDIYTGEMCKKPGEEGARDIYTGEGWFKMLSLSRSFTVADNSGMKSRTGGLSVSLAGPDGWVIGGGVVGLLTVVGWPHPCILFS
ncbi:AT-hook motif nuclear-localized protein 1 [Glycine soja]